MEKIEKGILRLFFSVWLTVGALPAAAAVSPPIYFFFAPQLGDYVFRDTLEEVAETYCRLAAPKATLVLAETSCSPSGANCSPRCCFKSAFSQSGLVCFADSPVISAGCRVGRLVVSEGTVGCQTEDFKIELVDLVGVEPAGTSKREAKISQDVIAKVTDSAGQAVSSAQVKLEANVVSLSGGHAHHDPLRPKGKLRGSPTSGCVSATDETSLTCTTNAEGRVAFTFFAPEPAGVHKIKASCTDRTCTQQGPDTIEVKVPGLTAVPPSSPSSVYVLIGTTESHPDNHYLTPTALGQLQQLASLYRERFPDDLPLHLNDASLEWGGHFDIQLTWDTGEHSEHRRGTVIDIRANDLTGAIPPQNFQEFEEIAAIRGMHAKLHKMGTPSQHYHVRLLGQAE